MVPFPYMDSAMARRHAMRHMIGMPLSGKREDKRQRTSFLYFTRCGWSASGPFRRFKSSMYAP